MPKASKVNRAEKENIVKIAYALKKNNPKISQPEIAKIVQRSPSVVSRAMSDKKFSKYSMDFKKHIDSIRFQAIAGGDLQVLEAIEKRELKPYQLIGMSKTYYEQSFGLQENQNRLPAPNVNVQIVEGDVAYNAKSNTNEAS